MSGSQWVGTIVVCLVALAGLSLLGIEIYAQHERARLRREAFGQYRQVATHRARLALLQRQLNGPVEDQATRDYLRRQAQWPMASANTFRATYLEQDVVMTSPPEDGFSVGDLSDLLKWFDRLESELAAVVLGTRLQTSLQP